jgi:hypothetical protein
VHAQGLLSPYVALEPGALNSATAEAQKTMPDAVLKAVATVGGIVLPAPFGDSTKPSGLDPANGQSMFWAYAFYSPAQNQTTVIAVGKVGTPPLGFYQAIAAPTDSTAQFPIPTGATPLDITGEYANSDDMVTRLATDTAFIRFRQKFPNRKADFAGFADALDTTGLIPGFPVDAPIWLVSFGGEGDSSMFCAVASKAGTAFCQRVEIPSAVREDQASTGGALTVSPNPAHGITRIGINPPAGTRFTAGASAMLYNTSGEKVLDLTGSMAGSGFRTIELDAASLPAGAYFCVVQGGGWIHAVKIVVE